MVRTRPVIAQTVTYYKAYNDYLLTQLVRARNQSASSLFIFRGAILACWA